MATTQPVRPAQYSPREWDVRCTLAACYRLFVKYGWTDLIYTHISARHPDNPEHYFINPYGLLFDEVRASNLVHADLDGVDAAITSATAAPRPGDTDAVAEALRAGFYVVPLDPPGEC